MNQSASGGPLTLLRIEGMAVLIAAIVFYTGHGAGWGVFAACFLLPDLAFFAYLAGPRAGAIAYNATHSYIGALACLLAGAWFTSDGLLAASLIWLAHIGFDRMLGYGLKYSSGFRHTHLGPIGRPDKTDAQEV